MRDDGDLQTELTRSESHLIRERFLSSLSEKSSGHFHKRPNGHFEKRSNFRKQPFYQGQTGQNSNKKICLNKLIAGTLIIRKMVIMTIIKEITLTDFRENLIRKVEIAGSHLTGK